MARVREAHLRVRVEVLADMTGQPLRLGGFNGKWQVEVLEDRATGAINSVSPLLPASSLYQWLGGAIAGASLARKS